MLHLILFSISFVGSILYNSNLVSDFNKWLSTSGLDEKHVFALSILIYSLIIYIFNLVISKVVSFFKDKNFKIKLQEQESKIIDLENEIKNINQENKLLKEENKLLKEKFTTYTTTVFLTFERIRLQSDIPIEEHVNNCKEDLTDLIKSSEVEPVVLDVLKIFSGRRKNNYKEPNIIN